MAIAIRQNRERTVTDIELNIDEDAYVEAFIAEMQREYGSTRCHIETEHHNNSTIYKMYEYGDYELLNDTITILEKL